MTVTPSRFSSSTRSSSTGANSAASRSCRIMVIAMTGLPRIHRTSFRAPPWGAPLLDSNELRPVLHLHARHEPILAVLGLENRCFAFLHIEPVLAQSIDDVEIG